MTKTNSPACFVFDRANNRYLCTGNWSILHVKGLLDAFKQTSLSRSKEISVSGASLGQFDSAGALTLIQCIDLLKQHKNQVTLVEFNEQQHHLLQLIEDKRKEMHYEPPSSLTNPFLYQIGEETIHKLNQVDGLIVLVGNVSDKIWKACSEWRRFQFPSIVSNINSAGLRALPILALLSFLIGIVLAYQMGLQLETYGASAFIAYLSSMAIFREFGPLITAIIVAGRTSSSFTAQIGSMKINEEIDALNTMGLSPVELIVVPKILGLLIAFPLLIFWSDIFSIIGAMLMSKSMLHVGYYDFLIRLQDTVGAKQMLLGLYKAPAFALIVALVGCFQGLLVQSNTDSVGTQTTKSVVQSLFLIIIADAIYSVAYSWLDL